MLHKPHFNIKDYISIVRNFLVCLFDFGEYEYTVQYRIISCHSSTVYTLYMCISIAY